MPITFSSHHPFATLSDSNVDKVLAANTLNEATKITSLSELINRIIDWFQGGTQYQTIKELFETIQSIKGEGNAPESNRLAKFLELRALVLAEHRRAFTLEITERNVNQDWGYTLKVDSFNLYACDEVFEKTQSHDERDNFVKFHAVNIRMNAETAFQAFKVLEDPREFIECNIEFMVDGEAGQDALKEKLDTSAYSKENFIGFKASNDPASFIACFKKGEELEFSNRTPTHSELRGILLKNALEKSEYANLKDLVLQGHLTEKDAMLQYALTPVRLEFYTPLTMDCVLNDQELLALNKELASVQVGNTNLAKLWGLNTDEL